MSAPPRDWRPQSRSSNESEGSSLSDQWCPNALPALQALLPGAASLQGLHPFAGWRRRLSGFPLCDALALLAFALLGAFPFPCPESQRPPRFRPDGLVRAAPRPRTQRFRRALLPCLTATSRALSGKVPVWVLLPVLQSFKGQGNWLASPEAAGPLRFPSSSQPSPAGCRTG